MSTASEAALRRWVEEVTGVAVNTMERLTGGASRVSYRIDSADGARYLLRVDTGGGPLSGTDFDLEREYRVLRAIDAEGFPVPEILAFDAGLNALLMGYIDGYNSYQRTLDAPRQEAQQRELLELVQRLQRIDPRVTGLVGEQRPGVAQALRQELDVWQQLYRQRVTEPLPVLDFCWYWLRSELPDGDAPAVLVHGDLGPGNFMFDDSGSVLALIDWELTHTGHPLEDLACVLCRALGAPFGDPAQLVRWYGEVSGAEVDRRAMSYCIVLVLARWSVGINMALSRPSVDLDVPMLLTFRQSNTHALLRELAAHYELPMPAVDMTPAAEEGRLWYDYLIDNLSGPLADAQSGDFARHRMQGLAQLGRLLRDVSAYGHERYAREELERIETLLGQSCSDVVAARRALSAALEQGALASERDVVAHLLWWGEREQQLLSAAMGAMAERRIDY